MVGTYVDVNREKKPHKPGIVNVNSNSLQHATERTHSPDVSFELSLLSEDGAINYEELVGKLSNDSSISLAEKSAAQLALLEKWSEVSPREVASWLLAQKNFQIPLTYNIVKNIALFDSKLSLEVVLNNCDYTVRRVRAADVFSFMVREDMRKSVELMASIPSDVLSPSVWTNVYDRVSLYSNETAMKWVESFAPNADADALDMLSIAVATTDPGLAFELSLRANGGSDSESLRDRIALWEHNNVQDYNLERLRDSWNALVEKDPVKAEKILKDLPEDIHYFFKKK